MKPKNGNPSLGGKEGEVISMQKQKYNKNKKKLKLVLQAFQGETFEQILALYPPASLYLSLSPFLPEVQP